MRDPEREAETQAEGEAGSLQGAWCGTRSQDPGMRPWAEGRWSTAEPPGRPLHFSYLTDFTLLPVCWGPGHSVVNQAGLLICILGLSSQEPSVKVLRPRCSCSVNIPSTFFFKDCVYLIMRDRERGSMHVSRGWGQRERKNLKQTPCSEEPQLRAWSHNPEIMTWA